MVETHSSNFRVITTNFLGVRIFRKFTVLFLLNFAAHSESFPNGYSVNLAAPVGLLTRNIKVIGGDHEKLFEESYGARVLVGLLSTKDQTYTGRRENNES